MAETAEKRKKIYKVATELNLSHETLIDFLRKKGHVVKSHMSNVDDDMMREILIHFKKERDVAEKHQRKVAEMRERRRAEKRAAEAAEAEASATPTATAEVGPETGAPAQEPPPASPAAGGPGRDCRGG